MDQYEKNRRFWCMLAHLSALSGYFIGPWGNFIGPVLVWQIKKNEIPEVEQHAKDALNFQLTMLIGFVIGYILVFVIIGVFVLIALAIFNFVCVLIAGIRTNNGDSFNYPFLIRFIK